MLMSGHVEYEAEKEDAPAKLSPTTEKMKKGPGREVGRTESWWQIWTVRTDLRSEIDYASGKEWTQATLAAIPPDRAD